MRILASNSLASDALELVRFKSISTAMTDSPKTDKAINCPPSKISFGKRHQATIPGLRAAAKSTNQTPKGIKKAATRTGSSKGSVTKKTALGTMNNKANRK